jgi:hypothetical protein
MEISPHLLLYYRGLITPPPKNPLGNQNFTQQGKSGAKSTCFPAHVTIYSIKNFPKIFIPPHSIPSQNMDANKQLKPKRRKKNKSRTQGKSIDFSQHA